MLGAHVVFRDLAVEIFVRIPFLLAAANKTNCLVCLKKLNIT